MIESYIGRKGRGTSVAFRTLCCRGNVVNGFTGTDYTIVTGNTVCCRYHKVVKRASTEGAWRMANTTVISGLATRKINRHVVRR